MILQAVNAKIMSSLPVGYDSLLSAWDTTPEASKALDIVTLRLYQQETYMKHCARMAVDKVSTYVAASSK